MRRYVACVLQNFTSGGHMQHPKKFPLICNFFDESEESVRFWTKFEPQIMDPRIIWLMTRHFSIVKHSVLFTANRH